MDNNNYLLIMLLIYFLPALIAVYRSHLSALAIFVLTLLLGWSGLGWIVALIWACTGNVRPASTASTASVAAPVTQISVTQTQAPHSDLERKLDALAVLIHDGSRGNARREAPRLPGPGARIEAKPSIEMDHHFSRAGQPYYRNEIPPAPAGYLVLRGPALYGVAVAGCSHYQAELDAVAGGRRDAPVYFRTNALVYAEPDNAHDPNAVAVDVAGLRVGYIARDEAPLFAAELAALAGVGAYACRALVENGWPHWYVKLDADRPLELRR